MGTELRDVMRKLQKKVMPYFKCLDSSIFVCVKLLINVCLKYQFIRKSRNHMFTVCENNIGAIVCLLSSSSGPAARSLE